MRVEDHYPGSVLDFEELLAEAEDQCSGEWASDFVRDMREKYDKWGETMYLSDKQHAALKRIAYGD